MKHIVMGTAGHVDHGKTSLVRALTGVDCDTHKEEKQRGMTIHLGFAHLACPSGLCVGIVDVPGHKDFVHTTVAGMGGIDLALLVVAADGGVMPQTAEHLDLLDLLGVRAGIVALSRADLAERAAADRVERDVRALARGTFLADAPVVRTSAATGQGIAELAACIERRGLALIPRRADDVFRMFPDRWFAAPGFGTVVNGSVLSGRLAAGSAVYIVPGPAAPARVRRLERYHADVAEIAAGERAALNLAGVKHDELRRGFMVADRPLPPAVRLDARIALCRRSAGLKRHTRLKFHFGTFETVASVALLERERLEPGDSALVRIRLAAPCPARHGDRFVLRAPSLQATVGGGTVLDPWPRGRQAEAPRTLARIEASGLSGLLGVELARQSRPLDRREIAGRLGFTEADVLRCLRCGPPDVVCYDVGNGTVAVAADQDARVRRSVGEALRAFHARRPLQATGPGTSELAGGLGIPHHSAEWDVFPLVLDSMAARGELKRVGNTWALAGHTVVLRPADTEAVAFAEVVLRQAGMHALSLPGFQRAAADRKAPAMDAEQTFAYLAAQGKAYAVEGHYIHAAIVDDCRRQLLQALADTPEGVSVSAFRDRIRGNRKIALLLMALFDREGLTRRSGDVRVPAGAECRTDGGARDA
ncbi:MAG: selenocysteine-specific translation elongation factor [Lentisphaerae bacterium]|nr:selenocysteine-specific translation elongation factor [Lentisphaerota bacterium]